MYIEGWNGKSKESKTSVNPDFEDIQAFNLMNGIERVQRKSSAG